MYTSIDGFVKDYGHECGETQKVFAALTDKSLAQSVANDHRTLGRIGWHLVTTYPEMCGLAGIPFSGVGKDDPVPKTATEIAAAYQKVSQQTIAHIQKNWKDATLAEVKNFYGMDWPLGLALQILVRHEIHHRGQMTVLMRQAGLKVPGVYGPSRDEWSATGMQPPTV